MVATTSKEQLLTEAEILAMPEDDYMNPAQLAFFRDRLARMRDEAARERREHRCQPARERTRRRSGRPGHGGSRVRLRVRDRERKLIKKIEEALGRIDEGEYGWCEKPATRSASAACWPARPRRCPSTPRSAASAPRSCTAE